MEGIALIVSLVMQSQNLSPEAAATSKKNMAREEFGKNLQRGSQMYRDAMFK